MQLQSIPNSYIFKNNFVNANPIDNKNLCLKPTLQKDEVCFCANKAPKLPKEKILSAILQKSKMNFASIVETKPVMIKKIIAKDKTKNVKAYMIKAKGINAQEKNSQTMLGVFTKEGEILGHIDHLSPNEYKFDRLADNLDLGKYLRLHNLNCSYQNEYKGVGTVLIDKAKEESKHLNLDGQLRVFAHNSFDKSKNSPVPFYAKKGFISAKHPSQTKEELIIEYSKPEAINDGIDMYFLTPENEFKLRQSAQ